MTMRTTARLFTAAALTLGLLAGCASTGDEEPAADSGKSAAETAIADAKAANADAAALGNEWRDTGSMIKEAEKLLAEGKEEEALKKANAALKQAQDAQKQAADEDRRLMAVMATTDSKSLSSADSRSTAAVGAGGSADSYTVERGDNLWSISGKDSIYADPYQWPLIYKANRSQIKDADLIYPGQTFDIDRNASSAEVDAAINHARTRGAWSVGDVESSDMDYLNK